MPIWSGRVMPPMMRSMMRLAPARASSSLQSTKIRRLLRSRVIESPAHAKLCISASKCEQYDLPQAMAQLTGRGLKCTMTTDAVITSINSKDVFVLQNGTAVAWDMSESDVIAHILHVIRAAEINSFSDIETEDMDYVEETPAKGQADDLSSGMIGDCIFIYGENTQERQRDKLAFSSGMARHTKLSAIEMRAEVLINQVRNISNRMASGKKALLSHHEALKLTGKLLQVRGNLNLYSGITETPDVYWTEPNLERLYELISKKLDVEERIEILNKKLDYVADTVNVIKADISEKISLRLEWLIIALISIEVVFELRHFVNWQQLED